MKKTRRQGVTVFRDTIDGQTVHITNRAEKYVFPYVCAVKVKKPYVRPEDRRNPEGRHG